MECTDESSSSSSFGMSTLTSGAKSKYMSSVMPFISGINVESLIIIEFVAWTSTRLPINSRVSFRAGIVFTVTLLTEVSPVSVCLYAPAWTRRKFNFLLTVKVLTSTFWLSGVNVIRTGQVCRFK